MSTRSPSETTWGLVYVPTRRPDRDMIDDRIAPVLPLPLEPTTWHTALSSLCGLPSNSRKVRTAARGWSWSRSAVLSDP